MELRTNDRVYSLKLSLGETLCVEFCPLGLNAPPSGKPTIGFTVSTMTLPGGGMALRIQFPDGPTFEAAREEYPLTRYLIRNPDNAKEMIFVLGERRVPRAEIAVKRVAREGRKHGGHDWGER